MKQTNDDLFPKKGEPAPATSWWTSASRDGFTQKAAVEAEKNKPGVIIHDKRRTRAFVPNRTRSYDTEWWG